MNIRNLISSCLLVALSIFTFILIIIFFSSDEVNEIWDILIDLIYLIIIPISFFLADLEEKAIEKRKRPRFIYVMIALIVILSVAISIYFAWRLRRFAFLFVVPTIYFAIILISILLAGFKEKRTEKGERPKHFYLMMALIAIIFVAAIVYSILHFRWFAPRQYDMPPAAIIPIPYYIAFLITTLTIFGVLNSSRMYLGKPRETWKTRIFHSLIFLLVTFGIIYIGLASKIIPEKKLDTELFFNFSSPVILSLLSLILSILIFNLRDDDEKYTKEEDVYTN